MKKKNNKISLVSYSESNIPIITSYDSFIDGEAFEIFKRNLDASSKSLSFSSFFNAYLDGKENPNELTMTKIKYFYDYLTKRNGGISIYSSKKNYSRIDFDSHLSFEDKSSLIREYLRCCCFRKCEEIDLEKIERTEEKLRDFPDSQSTTLYLRKLVSTSKLTSELFKLLGLDLNLDKNYSIQQENCSLRKKT